MGNFDLYTAPDTDTALAALYEQETVRAEFHQITGTPNPADAVRAWVLADRDNEREAFERAYDALYPRRTSQATTPSVLAAREKTAAGPAGSGEGLTGPAASMDSSRAARPPLGAREVKTAAGPAWPQRPAAPDPSRPAGLEAVETPHASRPGGQGGWAVMSGGFREIRVTCRPVFGPPRTWIVEVDVSAPLPILLGDLVAALPVEGRASDYDLLNEGSIDQPALVLVAKARGRS